MKRTLTSIAMATLFASICLLASTTTTMAQAEQGQELPVKEAESPASNTCPDAQTFTYGSGAGKIAFCITTHGNIQGLESPANIKQVPGWDGYVICGTGMNTAYDTGAFASGLEEPNEVSQPNGPHTLPLLIIRLSTDGKLQFIQQFFWDKEKKAIGIDMQVDNISGVPIQNFKMARYADIDADGTPLGDIFDVDSDSVLARDAAASGPHHGLLFSVSTYSAPHTVAIETYNNWKNTRFTCSPIAEAAPTAVGDYIGRLTYNGGTLTTGHPAVFSMYYRRF
jgi:hypothetical protein